MKKSHICIILICVVVSIAAAFFLLEWKIRKDRATCIINTRNVQQAFRGYIGMNQSKPYAELPPEKMLDALFTGPGAFMRKPVCPSGGTYTFHDYKVMNPRLGFIFCTCSHAETLNHKPDNTANW